MGDILHLAVIHRQMFTVVMEKNIAVSQISDVRHSTVVVVPVPELHRHRRKPFQDPSKTAQAGKRGGQTWRKGKRPGIEISAFKHL